MKRVLVGFSFVLIFAFQSPAQSLLKDGKIPDDLLITLKEQGAWGGAYYETTINSKGDFSFVSRGGLPVAVPPVSKDAKKKPPKNLEPKLSEEKLRSLIAEFEKIQFFRFGKDFPQEDEKVHYWISDAGTEVISIRINGQTKEVSNYLGEFLNRDRLLGELAEKIRGAGIWNYENGEIPKDFEVSYRITEGERILRSFKIKPNGKVLEDLYSTVTTTYRHSVFDRSKKVGKLSKRQLKELIGEFERTTFSTFRYSILAKDDGCSNDVGSALIKRRHISVRINRIHSMYASLYENCNSIPDTRASKFEDMVRILLKTVRSVGVRF